MENNQHAEEQTIARVLRRRLWVYNFLSRYYFKAPSSSELGELVTNNSLEELLDGEQTTTNEGLTLLLQFLSRVTELSNQELEDIQQLYQTLFVGPGHLPAPPWESVYRSRETIIFDEHTLVVRDFYADFGVRVPNSTEPDDHIALELAFMGRLIQECLTALEGNKLENVVALLRAQKDFLVKHLLGWVDEFCELLMKATHHPFYKGLALLTSGFLDTDKDLLMELILDLKSPSPRARASCRSNVLVGSTSSVFQDAKKDAARDGKGEVTIIPTAGTNNCGGSCVIKGHVKDGVVVRISTDEEQDLLNSPQIRACVRGRFYRQTWFHPDRLKYPMKRVGKRGENKWKQITWDEATTIIASETKRIKETYGPASRYVNYAWGYNATIQPMNLAKRLLALDGGYLDFYNTYSSACTSTATPYTYGTGNTGNSQDDWVNSKLIILWGHNPAETIHGSLTNYYLRKAKDAGTKIIVIDPRYSDTAVALADQWIPLLPTTDNALMDAMAYVMITENLHDQAFLDKYCSGFDEEHLPAGIPAGQSYKSYVLGLEDNTPKTPVWAEKICRVPADTIITLAREFATMKPAALIQGWGPQRHAYGEQPARGATVLAAMTGNVGNSGGGLQG